MVRFPNPNIEILENTVHRLGPLADELVFVGGCATGLLLTDPAAPPLRATMDVDVIVEVGSLAAYHSFSRRLRDRGFVEDSSEGAPICRWKSENIILDVMPTDPTILGFGSSWFARAFAAGRQFTLPSGRKITLLPAEYFLATKLEAFDHRGNNDYLLSRDMEDVVAVIDGRPEIVDEIKDTNIDLKEYLVKRFSALRRNPEFIDALPGHLPPDNASQARSKYVLMRIEAIV